MTYKRVRRIITIEFREFPEPHRDFELVVTDDYAVVRSGDIIEWKVQGAPPRVVVTVGNFTLWGRPWRVTRKGNRAIVQRDPVLRDALVRRVAGNLVVDTDDCAVGVYKYDVLVNGRVVLDPEVEIRGPKG